jgi:hypothetical protein
MPTSPRTLLGSLAKSQLGARRYLLLRRLRRLDHAEHLIAADEIHQRRGAGAVDVGNHQLDHQQARRGGHRFADAERIVCGGRACCIIVHQYLRGTR